jgi:hypothetical protein
MKKIIINSFIIFVVTLAPQVVQAQGTMNYLSNLGEAPAGSLAVGSNSWFAALFRTGTNVGGYMLNSVQFAMTNATGNPSGFTATLNGGGLYPGGNPPVGSTLGALGGSLNPVSGGIFTYTPVSNLTLSANTYYAIVLTAGTAVANGAYEWDYANPSSYNPSGGWLRGNFYGASDGFSWGVIPSDFPLLAINATAIPEPGVLGLLGLGGLVFLWHRRKAKTV